MTKFSKRFKLSVVKEYLSTSLGSRTIARQYGIGSETTVLNWTQQYQRFGIEGLEVRRPVRVYDAGFKLSILKWLKTEHASLTTDLHFKCKSVL